MKARFYIKEPDAEAPAQPVSDEEAKQIAEAEAKEWVEITNPSGDTTSDAVVRVKRERPSDWAEIEAAYTAWKAEGDAEGKGSKGKGKDKDKDVEEADEGRDWTKPAKADDKAKARK